MRFEFKPSFDRSLKSCQSAQADRLRATCLAFLDLLECQIPLPVGIGLKRLRGDFWEIRHGLHDRVLFRWRDDFVEFVLAGDHDSIKNFLKKI